MIKWLVYYQHNKEGFNMEINFTVTNNNPSTIFNKLKKKLGREPNAYELQHEVYKIITEAQGE
jgi:hypothetical protein